MSLTPQMLEQVVEKAKQPSGPNPLEHDWDRLPELRDSVGQIPSPPPPPTSEENRRNYVIGIIAVTIAGLIAWRYFRTHKR